MQIKKAQKLTSNKATKLSDPSGKHYRDQDAIDNQEVVTPPELTARLYEFLSEKELSGDILDPCVGPGALVTPLFENPNFESLTMLDIQELHIDALKEKYPGYQEFNQDAKWDDW